MKQSKNRIAIPIWNDYVSNVFDFANQLFLVDVEDNKGTNHRQIPFVQQAMQQRTHQLVELNVDVLICGTISRSLATMLMASHIEVIPFVTGLVDEVLAAYLNKQLDQAKFLQPGCNLRTRRHFCRQYRCKHRWRRAGTRKGRAPELQGEGQHHRDTARPNTGFTD
jgi:predicted Fe-Mo cluster-binding NifX family protein